MVQAMAQPIYNPQQPRTSGSTPQQASQQYGLAGATSAMQGGLQGGLSQLQGGVQQGMNTLLGGYDQGSQWLNQGIGALGNVAQGQSAQGHYSGMNAAQAGSAAQSQAQQANTMAGQGQFNQAINGANRWTGAGLNAQSMMANRSGANGADAQAQAYKNFQESPGQSWLREQGQNAIINQSSATGGLHGGRVQKELMRQGQGMASQDYQNQFANLGALAGQGLQAQGMVGQLRGQAGSLQAQLEGQNAQMGTNVNMQNATALNNRSRFNAQNQQQANSLNASALNNMSQFNAGNRLQMNMANMNATNNANTQRAQMYGQGANMASSLAGKGAQMQYGAGQLGSNMMMQTGSNLANARSQAGRDLSQNLSGASQNMANYQNQQGINNSNMIGDASSNLNQMIQAAAQSGDQQGLATLLANINSGQANQMGATSQYLGNTQGTAGINAANAAIQQGNINNNLLSGLTGAAGAMDWKGILSSDNLA